MLTVHEDLGHDVSLRVIAGSDIFDRFLSKRRDGGSRPSDHVVI